MSMTADIFFSALPAGEWADVQIVSDPGGMMAARTQTIHAIATWARSGGVPAYLKCVFGRGASAGPNTRRLAGTARLARVRDRLEAAKAESSLPVVRLLAIEMLDAIPALLIAMERVRPLHGIINSGSLSQELSVSVLESLSSSACNGWIHFDICPRNVAITAAGSCVLIDPESLYPVQDLLVDISLPAFKFNRTPRQFADECANAAVNGNLSAEMARRKHDAELIVLAAECSLGLFGGDLSQPHIEAWCATAPAPQPVREFWRERLLKVAANEVEQPDEIVRMIKSLNGGALAVATPPTVRPAVAMETREHMDLSGIGTWADLEDFRRALRREQLRGGEIEKYRERLVALARENAKDRRWWEELLLVVLAYERDPVLAQEIATEALLKYGPDEDFRRKYHLAKVWARVR